MKPTCEEIAFAALGPPLKRQGEELFYRAPWREDKNPSLKINRRKDTWADFPAGISGNWWALAARLSGRDPSDKPGIRGWLGDLGLLSSCPRINNDGGSRKEPVRAEWVRNQLQKEGFHVVAEYQYGQAQRKIRFEKPVNGKAKKTFRWEHRKGDLWWAGKGRSPLALYANALFWERDQLGAVLGLESEGKADLAENLGIPAFSFKELGKEHCHHFSGLTVVLWPDKDDSGIKQTSTKAQLLLLSQQPKSVGIITPPSELPDKGDIVDAVRNLGWNRERIEKLIDDATPVSCDRTPLSASLTADWKHHLILNQQGNLKPIFANAITALRYAPEWCGVLGFNEFSLGTVALKSMPWEKSKPGREWSDHEDRLAANWLQHQGICVSVEITGQAVQAVARDRCFHPVREYLDSLKWDGKKRIDSWLSRYLGVEAGDYIAAVGARWLISAVARIYRPGVKADCCLILEGPQGLKKSTALKTIAGEWFTDEVAELGSKDAAMQTHGVWIIELSELDSINKAEISKIKSFMSRSTDRYRPPYGKRLIEAPRQSVFAGTVNQSAYLRDDTGGRRFWPVACTQILIDDLARDRDQLWAETVVCYRNGAIWWLDSVELTRLAETEQYERYEGDPWGELIAGWLEDPKQRYDENVPLSPFTSTTESVSVSDVLLHCIGKGQEFWTQADQNRVARCLRSFGWERYRAAKHVGKKQDWRYRRERS